LRGRVSGEQPGRHRQATYAWGFGAITIAIAVMRPLAVTPPMLALTARLMG